MLKIKLILALIILVGAAGGYAYVQKLRADNATLTINAVKLETAVAENNEVIEQQTQDLQKIRSTLEDVEETNAKLQADKDNLSDRLNKHDIGNLAENKPGLVEKIINKASDSAVRCMEIASGSPLTEEELNGTPNRECPSFWPDTATAE